MFTQFKTLATDHTFNFDASLTLAHTIFASVERLAALNLATTRSLLDHSVANITAFQGVKEVQSFATLQSTHAQPVIELAVAYSRSLYEIATETKDEIAKIVEQHHADTNTKVSGMVDKALKSAPAGSETAVATIRQAMDVASSAYDRMNKATKQVAKITQANVSAAGDAVLASATKSAQKAKKAA
jgi:phasin family protein